MSGAPGDVEARMRALQLDYAARLPANLGHDQQRMAFAARRGG